MSQTELIVPSRYILTREEETGCFVGVAYRLDDGAVKNELLWGYNKFLSVQLIGQANEQGFFGFYHTFVERYIKNCLNKPFDQVDIFRFYIVRGDFPEQPSDIRGELIKHFLDYAGKDVWTSYEHISGPYLADGHYITSQFTASRVKDLDPVISYPLILDPAGYRRNPEDLPLLGVIIAPDEISSDQRIMEDILIRTKEKKPAWVN